jgi:hypothetical protein
MKRAADKLIDIAAARPGTEGNRPGTKAKAKAKSKASTKCTSAQKPAQPSGDTTSRPTRPKKTSQPTPRPLNPVERTVVQLIHNGHSISAAMAQIGMSRRSFYTWREKNPRFQHATRNAREDYRGLVTDGLEDLQIATAQFLDACIRSDELPVRDRLRACNTFLRHVQSGAFVPASFPGDDPNPNLLDDDDLIGPDCTTSDATASNSTASDLTEDSRPSAPVSKPNPDPASLDGPINQAPTPEDPAENPAQNPTETHRPTVQSATAPEHGPTTAPTHSEQTYLSASTTNAKTTEDSEKTVQSVQSKTTETAQPTASEIRTPNLSDGFHPSPEHERRVSAETPIPPAQSQTAEGAPSSTSNNNAAPSEGGQRSDLAHTTRDERSNVAPPPLPPKPRETILTDAFLSATFLHKHEPRQAFERLLKHQLRAYAPGTPQEELLTFRITQKSWILRRLDTFERVIADSAVTKVRATHPNAAPAACIAMTFLTRNDTEETSFYTRIANQRRDHEAALDRLEAKLQTLQQRREAREDRREAREEKQRGPRLIVPTQANSPANPHNRWRSAS